MSNIPPLNYFMVQEEARAATENFNLILQEAFTEYKKVWNMYINLVKKCEGNNSRSFSKSKSDARRTDTNYKCTENMYIDEQEITNSVSSMEDVLAECTLNLNSGIGESNESSRSEKKKDITPGSPVFRRNNSNFSISTSRKSNCKSSSSKNIVADDNFSVVNEQENIKKNSVINASSTINVPSVFLCSTPTKSQKWSKSKKQNIKRSVQSKRTKLSSSSKKKNNLVNTRKERTNKVPLQIINNVASVSKNIHQTYKNSNKSYNIQVTMSPSSRKLKQTKLVFHKTKKTTELSNNSKSLDISQTTKTDALISDRDNILKCNAQTDSNGLKEKGTNEKCTGNIYDRVEVSKDVTGNNFAFIHTNTQIKNEVILQEHEQVDGPEINDPLNTSNESDSTFFEENECNARLNQNDDTCFDSNKSYASLMKDESKSKNGYSKKRRITSFETEGNIMEIQDIKEPIKKNKLSTLVNENCNECKQNDNEHCARHRSIFYKTKNVTTNSSTLLPDSPSSTT